MMFTGTMYFGHYTVIPIFAAFAGNILNVIFAFTV